MNCFLNCFMKRYFSHIPSLSAALLAFIGLSMATQALSAAFTPGNIVVYRVGDGSAALSSAATAVFLDEYTPSGTLVQSIAMPTAVSGGQRRLTGSGTSTSDGLISRSADGGCILVAGYDATLGTAAITGTTAAVANRIIGVVRPDGTADTSTVFAANYSTNNFRSAASTNCTDLWATGGNDGVRYTTVGGTTNTQVSNTVTNLRQINIFGGQLYISTASGTTRVGTVGAGTPTTSGQTITQLPSLPTSGSPYSFFFADLSSAVAGVDTLYIADEGTGASFGLQKYSLVSGAWFPNGSISGTGIRGLTGVVTGNSVALYAVNNAGALLTITDTTGYNATISGTFANIASAGTNRAFRGVALAPVAIATAADLTASVVGPMTANVSVNFNYGITLSNAGGTNATGVSAQFTLPPGVSYVSASTAGGFMPSQTAGVVTWSGGAIAAGGSVSLTVTVNAAMPSTITLPIGAAVIDLPNTVPESNETNNSSTTSVTTNVTAAANTAPTISVIPALSGTLSDSTNPSVTFTVSDAETLASSLTVTAISSTNTAVVPLANVALTNVNGTVTATITPAAVGYSDITMQVSDGALTTTQVLGYAASAASVVPTTSRYHYGASDASTAIALDANFMIVADDENQVLRVYNRQNSGYPVATFDYTSSLGLTDLSGGFPREVDIEAATRVGNRIYWLGSHSNASSGNARPNRYRLFATDVSGTGATTALSFVGYYTGLRSDLLGWDSANGHGLGANFLGLTASATTGVIPEATDGSGFNIEGLVMAPDNTTAYLAFRAPQTVPGSRTRALIVPVTNFASLVGGSPAAGPATFGAPIQLDLGGRGIREIQKNAANQYIIVAGPADTATGTAPKDFVLYTWNGNAASAPLLRTANLTALNSGGSFESIVEVPSSLTATSSIQLLSDNGDTIYYNDGTAAKDLTESRFKKSRSDTIALGAVSGIVPINTVQGSGTASPLVGQTVTVSGVVVANFEGPNRLGGFYIEAPDAEWDSDPATSEGLFIFTNNATTTPTAAVGDRVNVTGNVIEFGTAPNTLTEIVSPVVTIVSSGNPLPSAVTVSLPVTATTDLERFEGMRVTFTQTLTVSDNESLAQFGELTLSASGRIFQPTNSIDPNDNPASGTTSTGSSNVAAVTAQQSLNARSTITLDDNSTQQYPFVIPYWDNANNTLRLGTTVSNLNGIMGQAFGAYRILPTSAPNFTFASRPLTPPAVGGNVKVGSMNVLNYFNGNGAGGGFPTSRGADSLIEFNRQRAKIIAAIIGLNADVLALMEMENDGTGATSGVQDLVNGLNTASAPGTWAFIQDPAGYTTVSGGNDLIKPTMIYKTAVVTPVGASQTVNNTAFSQGRAPVAQIFQLLANGEQFTVVANHFKSKGSSAGQPGDTDQGDGQAQSNQTRRLQATALLGFITTLTAPGNPQRLITVGDYNAYGEEDPIDILRAGGLTTIINNSYSYLFDGQVGALDHALGTAALMSTVTGADEWHINADEPTLLDYNLENKSPPGCVSSCRTQDYNDAIYPVTPFRSSDHDPLLVGLNLKAGQTITFGVLANRLDNEAPFTVSATTTSSLTILFTSQTPTVCSTTSSNGSTVTLLSIGNCTIRASQAGDANFDPAVSVDRTFMISAAPVACVAGTFSTTGSTPCTVAPAGSFVAAPGATAAVLCPAGTFSAMAGAAACTNAPAGSFAAGLGNTAALQCPAGTFSAMAGSASCTNAPVGSFATGGATAATPCAIGSFTGSAGQTSCTPAPAGSFISTTGASTPTQCPAGTFSATTGSATCTNAPAGSFASGLGNTAAVQCPAGTFSAMAGSAACTNAPAGSFATAGATSATPCAIGTFTGSTGQTSCTPAPAGTFISTTGASTPTQCAAGTFSATAGSATCTNAPAGSFAPGTGNTASTQCPAGTFSAMAGSAACTNAPAGSFATAGATSATPCAIGSFTASAGQTSCTPAPAGSFISTPGASTPTQCPAGTFSAMAASAICTNAPAGSFAPGLGNTAATQCAAGSFSDMAGSSACTPAAIGSFVAMAGATAQITCPAGTTTITTGQISCLTIQTITFNSPASVDNGAAPITLTAIGGGSMQPVTFASQTTTICTTTGTNGSLLTFLGTGICTVRASQAGNVSFLPAANVDRNITVGSPAPPPIFPPAIPQVSCIIKPSGGIDCSVTAGTASVPGSNTATITGYQISCTNPNGVVVATQSTTTGNSLTLPTLPTGTIYTCLVTAQSSIGPSNPAVIQIAPQVIPLALRGQFDVDGLGFATILVRGSSSAEGNKATNATTQVGRWDGARLTFTPIADIGAEWNVLGLGDITSIGKSALISRNAAGNVRIDLNLPPTATSGIIVRDARLDWTVEAVGDLDGDGKADILWRYMKPGTNDSGVTFAWFMDGDQTKVNVNEVKFRGGAPLSWSLAGIVDLNSDKLGDIVWVSPTNQVRVLMGQTGRSFTNQLIGQLPAGYTILKLGDVDGDGKADIVMRDTDGNVRVWLMNGTSIRSTIDLPTTDKRWQLYAAGDFDGSGTMDMIWLTPDGSLTLWLVNRTNVAFPRIVSEAGRAPAGLVPVEP
jgi:predicted extracellular nuclease